MSLRDWEYISHASHVLGKNDKTCHFPNDKSGIPYNYCCTGKPQNGGFPSEYEASYQGYTVLQNDGNLVSKATDYFLVSNFIIGVNLNLPAVGMARRVSA